MQLLLPTQNEDNDMQIAHVQTHVIADAREPIQLPFITRILSCFRSLRVIHWSILETGT